MAIIKIPKPPVTAADKSRPVSSLLRTQLEHMQEAEFRLPANLQTNIYINAIKTEAEAAAYIKKVTEHLHAAHGIPVSSRKPVRTIGRSGLEIVASIEPEGTRSKPTNRSASNKSSKRKKSSRQKSGKPKKRS